MILTGPELLAEVRRGRITIDPFDAEAVEPNSYGFRLAPHVITYEDSCLDVTAAPRERHATLSERGTLLEPGVLYLGSTLECMGSPHYAATLYACRSVSTLGIWIQMSAPLGHMGAIIPWTLEIRVAHPVLVYPGMRIGKIAFWSPDGAGAQYDGKYQGSGTTIASRLAREFDAAEVPV